MMEFPATLRAQASCRMCNRCAARVNEANGMNPLDVTGRTPGAAAGGAVLYDPDARSKTDAAFLRMFGSTCP